MLYFFLFFFIGSAFGDQNISKAIAQQNVQQIPEIEQRVEQVLLEEVPSDDGIQIGFAEHNQRNPLKTIVRNESVPMSVPQNVSETVPQKIAEPVVEAFAEPAVSEGVAQQIPVRPEVAQIVTEPVVENAEPVSVEQPIVVQPNGERQESVPTGQQTPVEVIVERVESLPPQPSAIESIDERTDSVSTEQPIEEQPQTPPVIDVINVEPVPPQTLTDSDNPIVRRSAVKENVVLQTNTPDLRRSRPVVNTGYATPALALANTEPFVGSFPFNRRPIESAVNYERSIPQYNQQNVVQPVYVPQQFIQRYQPLATPSRVFRPQQSGLNQQPIYFLPLQTNYRTIPQYIRHNVVPNV